jgi:hypothetical protein
VREAPPVSVVCRGRGWSVAEAALHGAAAATLSAWALQHAGVFDGAALAATALLVALGAALLAWWVLGRRPPVTLRWDGQQWTLADEPVELAVMLDVAGLLLLRLRAPSRARRWLAASRQDAGPAWHALRVAACARPRPAA